MSETRVSCPELRATAKQTQIGVCCTVVGGTLRRLSYLELCNMYLYEELLGVWGDTGNTGDSI